MSKNTIIGIGAIAIIAIAAFYVIENANDGPLENAAEEVDDAIEEIAN